MVIVLDCVEIRPQLSVKLQDSVYDPPQAVCVPVIVPVTEPLIVQLAVLPAPLLYASDVPTGAGSAADIVRFGAAANSALAAFSTVIVLVRVDTLLQSSVKVQVSVYDPPHSVCEPVITPVADPLILQAAVLPAPLL